MLPWNECNFHQSDCFAYKNGFCTILVDSYGIKAPCPFFKTEEQLVADQLASNKKSEGQSPRND